MKTIVAILLFAGTLLAQSQSMPEPGGAYPLVLTVISAQRSARGGEMTTHIVGILSDDPQQTQLHMVCDGGIFSRGPDGKANTYPARYAGKSHQIKIQTREMGSDKIHEYKCKY